MAVMERKEGLESLGLPFAEDDEQSSSGVKWRVTAGVRVRMEADRGEVTGRFRVRGSVQSSRSLVERLSLASPSILYTGHPPCR